MIAAPRRGLEPFAAHGHHPPHPRARGHSCGTAARACRLHTPLARSPRRFLCVPALCGLPPVYCQTPVEGGASAAAADRAADARARACPARAPVTCVCTRRAHAGGDGEWVELVGRGWCLDAEGAGVTHVSGYVGASGAVGMAKCRAACVQKERQPRCVGVTYRSTISNGFCFLHGSKLTQDDKDDVFEFYANRHGNDEITRTSSSTIHSSSGQYAYYGLSCSVFMPGKSPARPAPPRPALPQGAARPRTQQVDGYLQRRRAQSGAQPLAGCGLRAATCGGARVHRAAAAAPAPSPSAPCPPYATRDLCLLAGATQLNTTAHACPAPVPAHPPSSRDPQPAPTAE